MKLCHVCLTECPDDAELCTLCGADLIPQEEPQKDKELTVKNPTFLTKFEDVVSAEIFEDILKENTIPSVSIENEEGSMRVLFGGSFFAKEIFVDETDLEKAKKLLKEFLENEENFSGEFFEEFEEEEN